MDLNIIMNNAKFSWITDSITRHRIIFKYNKYKHEYFKTEHEETKKW